MEVEALTSRGVQVHLIIEVTPQAWSRNILDLPWPDLPPGIHDGSDFLRAHLPSEVWERLSGCSGLHLAVFPGGLNLRAMCVAKDIRRMLLNEGVELVHSDGDTIRACLWMIPIRCPVVVNVHEPVMPFGMKYPAAALGKKLLLARATHAIVHSQECFAFMKSHWRRGYSHLSLAPMGVMSDITAWRGERSAETVPNSVVLWGQLSDRKGIETLLEAAPRVAECVESLRIVIAGSPVEDYELPEVPELKHGGRIDVRLGHVTNHDLCNLIESSTLTAAPYVDAMQSSVVLTSFAFGQPIVASDTGGLREQVVDGITGWLVPPRDAGALADVLTMALSNPDVVARARQEVSHRWSPRDSWTAFGDESVRVYERLLA